MSGVLLDTGSMSPTIVANIVIDSIMATPKKLVALLYSYSNSIGGGNNIYGLGHKKYIDICIALMLSLLNTKLTS